MKTIPVIFKKNGLKHVLVHRFNLTEIKGSEEVINSYALYKQVAINNENKFYGYEIHLIRVANAVQNKFPNGRVINLPEREILAKNEEFGLYAWSYNSKNQILEHYPDLKKKVV